MNKVPVLVRGGSIIPRKDRPRGSSGRMANDPYTLFITLSDDQTAEGELYVDDGESFDYASGAYIHRQFTLTDKKLTSTNAGRKPKAGSAYRKSMKDIRIERIIVVGVPKRFTGKKVQVTQAGHKWETTVTVSETKGKARSIVIRDPKVRIGQDWEIQF